MKSNAGKPLVVESDDAQRERIVTVLRDAGYKVSTEYRDGVRSVLAFDRDVLILGADPPKLDGCDLVSALKGSEPAQGTRVIMLTPGGSQERTRGLDLGDDDVL